MFSPLAKLRATMAKISSGDLSEAATNTVRLDDIGEMAREVEVFRRTALDKIAIDAQNAEQRAKAQAEAETRRAELSRLAASEEQSRTLAHLADALKKVAAGDLTLRLGEGFPEAYVQICEDFNSAVFSLGKAMRVAANGADHVFKDAKEVAMASEALTQRTEGDAANLDSFAQSRHGNR